MYWNLETQVLKRDWYDFVKNSSFEDLALQMFHFQYQNNELYQSYCRLIGTQAKAVQSLVNIPFLPIHFFKTHIIKTSQFEAPLHFESSGTTLTTPSKHYIKDPQLYLNTCISGFENRFGAIHGTAILCLMPSYLERNHSSLVYMAQELIVQSGHPDSGFYLYDFEALAKTLQKLQAKDTPIILFGVTFALLDFADYFPYTLQNVKVIETGGMKGRKKELTRAEVHEHLKKQWKLSQIYSEYGMTELCSQAYTQENQLFSPIATMKVLVRDINDPLTTAPYGKGALNVIDLSNIYSCSFIATEDMGEINTDGNFEVLGRMDISALRGCSLMSI